MECYSCGRRLDIEEAVSLLDEIMCEECAERTLEDMKLEYDRKYHE